MLIRSDNGVFGIKVHYAHIAQFGGYRHLLRILPNPKFILLTRNDVLQQAVSFSIAIQSGVWISGQKPINVNLKYDPKQIRNCLQNILISNSSWRYVLAGSGASYKEVVFEDLVDNIAMSVHEIAEFMGVKISPVRIPKEQATKRQSANVNKEWAIRFAESFDLDDELSVANRSKCLSIVKRKILKLFHGF